MCDKWKQKAVGMMSYAPNQDSDIRAKVSVNKLITIWVTWRIRDKLLIYPSMPHLGDMEDKGQVVNIFKYATEKIKIFSWHKK